MPQRLPPLTALRAFDATARLLSFTRAAEELAITQSAVSHQIKSLEGHLNVRLFDRTGRSLHLTASGLALVEHTQAAFALLRDGVDRARSVETSHSVTIVSPAAFATRWLLTALAEIRIAHPELDIRLISNDTLGLEDSATADVIIQFGSPMDGGPGAVRLPGDDIIAVARPDMDIGQDRHLRDILSRSTLIHTDRSHLFRGDSDWVVWTGRAIGSIVRSAHGVHVSSTEAAIQAARAGLGISLTPRLLVAEDLSGGSLISLFDRIVPGDYAHWLSTSPTAADDPIIRQLKDVILNRLYGSLNHDPTLFGAVSLESKPMVTVTPA